MAPKRILVTGAAGFIGQHLIGSLLREGISVRAIVRPGGSRIAEDLRKSVDQVEADLTDRDLSPAIFEGVETVYHLAGRYRPGQSASLLEELRRANVETTSNVASASLKAGVKRFIHLSSAAACEYSGSELVTEDTGSPVSSYGISKKEGEGVFKAIPPHQMAWTIFRPTVVFGESGENTITRLAGALRSGRFVLFGDGKNHVNFIYVGDVVSALMHSTGSDATHGRTYILADQPMRFIEVVEAIRQEAGITGAMRKAPAWVGHAAGSCFDVMSSLFGVKMPMSANAVRFMTHSVIYSGAKLKSDLRTLPKFNVREGIRRTVRQWAAGPSS